MKSLLQTRLMPWQPLNSLKQIRSHQSVRLFRRYSSTSCLRQLPPQATVFSAIQPTGVPHLGNWIGALGQWVDLQKTDAKLTFSIVDLHAITLPQKRISLRKWRIETLATLLAVGLDPSRCTLFFQSTVPAHAELMWVLSCTSSLGYLSRMTAWKSKTNLPDHASYTDPTAKRKAKLGLLAYPVLQAADILVHRAEYVPVGADQAQHLEFARECARNFNTAQGQRILREPETLHSPVTRIMSLRDPSQKMSKSHLDIRSRILLTDTEDDIRQKINSSITDSIPGISYEPITRPGVSNLLQILSHFRPGQSPQELATTFQNCSLRSLKEEVANQLSVKLAPVRTTYYELIHTTSGKKTLDNVARHGALVANQNANSTMKEVYEVLGMSHKYEID